jgi:hypothetical protein
MAVAVPDLEDRQDIGMRQGRNRVRFSLEPRERFRIVRDGGRNDPDRDVTIQTRIARKTSPTLPAPTGARIVYGPSVCPAASDDAVGVAWRHCLGFELKRIALTD